MYGRSGRVLQMSWCSWEEIDLGGHFSGYERPDAVAKGLCTVFGKGGGAYGVVAGKEGY